MIQRVKIRSCMINGWWYNKYIGLEIDIDTDRPTHGSILGYTPANTPHNVSFMTKFYLEQCIGFNHFVATEDYVQAAPKDNEDALQYLPKFEELA